LSRIIVKTEASSKNSVLKYFTLMSFTNDFSQTLKNQITPYKIFKKITTMTILKLNEISKNEAKFIINILENLIKQPFLS
jgi:hypothetical protein